MSRVSTIPPALFAAVAVWACARAGTDAPRPAGELPRFTPQGALVRPEGWEAWVMVGASTGLSYAAAEDAREAQGPGDFHNVYLQPWAYRYFLEHGAFPAGAMFVLAMYARSGTASPARAGFYEGERMPFFEVHLKQAGVDSTGWGFYAFSDSTVSAATLPGTAACYSCHRTEAALDNVFTQFYPALRGKAAGKAGTAGGSP